MADSNNKKANKLQTVKKIETAEEKSASKPVRCPKYEKDLEKGKTHICQIPFKYRDAWAYARAMKYINTRKDIEKKSKKKLSVFSCLMTLQKAKEQEIQRERLT